MYQEEVNVNIINYLQVLEHILNTGKNILDSTLIKDYKFINIEKILKTIRVKIFNSFSKN